MERWMIFVGGSVGIGMLEGEVGVHMVEEIGEDMEAEGEEEGADMVETEDTAGIEEGMEGTEDTGGVMEEIVDTEATAMVDEAVDEEATEATGEDTTAEMIAETLTVETTDL